MYGAHTNAYRSKLDLAVKRSMYDNYFSNFGRLPVPDDTCICKDSATSHPWFWRIRFLNVFSLTNA